MINEFLNYEQSLALKELGFDEPCFKYIYVGDTGNNYDHFIDVQPSKSENFNKDLLCISQPTFSQAFRFFRDKYGLVALINIGTHEFSYKIFKNGNSITPLKDYLDYNGTYEEAEEVCINKLIELVKEANNEQ